MALDELQPPVSSIDALEKKLKSFECTTFTKFWKREARTIEAARKRINRHLNPDLNYYQLKYASIHGGQAFRPKSRAVRKFCQLHK